MTISVSLCTSEATNGTVHIQFILNHFVILQKTSHIGEIVGSVDGFVRLFLLTIISIHRRQEWRKWFPVRAGLDLQSFCGGRTSHGLEQVRVYFTSGEEKCTGTVHAFAILGLH